MRIFAKRLREERTERGLTCKQLGDAVGIDHSTIVRWEHGINDITSDNLVKLVNYFGVTAGYLIGTEN